jgi:hypothetical protein
MCHKALLDATFRTFLRTRERAAAVAAAAPCTATGIRASRAAGRTILVKLIDTA